MGESLDRKTKVYGTPELDWNFPLDNFYKEKKYFDIKEVDKLT